MTSTSDFRALHVPGTPLVLPNAWDYATAAWLVAAGFTTIGTTSLGVAAANGIPDAHGVARDETVALARRLQPLPCLYTVDIEGGFSEDPGQVADLAAALSELGAAGVNIEDGRADGTLADQEHQAGLIAVIKQRVPDLFVNARTDTFWLGDGDINTTIERTRRYVAAGADGIFVPGIAQDDAIKAVVSSVDAPLNVLYLPGKTPVDRMAGLGVARISTGSLLFRAALKATIETAGAVRDGGDIDVNLPSYGDVQRMLETGG